MKTVLVVSIFLTVIGLVLSDPGLPTFEWIKEEFSSDGIPLFSINFHDGNPNDVAIFKQLNPIPRQPGESEEQIDVCIFGGFLQDESAVYVVLTRGCPFENSFEIQFRSSRLEGHLFKVVKGKVTSVPSVYSSKELYFDKALDPPTAQKLPNQNNKHQSNGYRMSVALNIDQSFSDEFGDEAFNVLRRVAVHAEAWYTHSSLNYPIAWVILEDAGTIPDKIEANENNLLIVGKYNIPEANSNLYLCFQDNLPGLVGIAYIGTVCYVQEYRSAIVEYLNTEMTTGELVAHEIGHNCGMRHDFGASTSSPRYDSKGNLCTGIGGVMDYNQIVSKWSDCSNEDFAGTYHNCLASKDN